MRSEYTVKDDKFGINAYVYGKRTVLEFIEAPNSLVIKDKQGLTVSYERIGERFYRLARQLDKFTATVNGDEVLFDVYKPEQIVVLPPVVAEPLAQPVVQPTASAAALAPVPAPAASAQSSAPGSAAIPAQAASTDKPMPATAPEKPPVVASASPSLPSRLAVQPVDLESAKPAARVWEVEASDLSVYAAIKRWTRITQAQETKWQLSWEIPVDYPVTITGTYSGNFEEAVGDLLEGYSKADYRAKVCLYSNNVVRVVRFLGTGTECD